MIYLDSNILIYFLEQNSEFFEAAKKIITPALEQKIHICTSTLSIAEITSGGDADLSFFDLPSIYTIPLDDKIAALAGQFRREHTISLPDAVHLATAVTSRVSMFITNDQKLVNISASYLQSTSLSPYK